MGAELNFQNRGKPRRRFLVCNRRKSGADGHFCGDAQKGKDSSRGRKRGTQKVTSCGEEGRFGHNTGSNFPDNTGKVRDGEVLDVLNSDFSLTGATERTGGGASVSCRDFSVGGKDISGGNFSFDVANECAGVAEISDDLDADISGDLGFDGLPAYIHRQRRYVQFCKIEGAVQDRHKRKCNLRRTGKRRRDNMRRNAAYNVQHKFGRGCR